jgi:hypothetical protein
MHGSQHAGYEFVDAIALLDQRHQSRNSTLIVCAAPEVGEYKLLKGINLILQSHEVGDRFVAEQWSTRCPVWGPQSPAS